MKKLLLIFLLFITASLSANQPPPEEDSKKRGLVVYASMVVTGHPEATNAGLLMLRRGGTALDAAIATQFALAVVLPSAGNLAGGGFMVIRWKRGNSKTLDFREKAPLAATKNMFLDKNGNVVEGLSTDGGLSSGVPGTVAGMLEAHYKYGTLQFYHLIDPAIALAEKGFPITEKQAEEFNSLREEFKKNNPGNSYLVKDTPWKKGDTLVQKDLAETLKLIRKLKHDGFYKGVTAENMLKEVKRTGGIITQKDLDEYKPVWRKPLTGKYKDYKFISMPPPSSGGIALCQLLKMIEPHIEKAKGDSMNRSNSSAAYIHLLAEAEKRAYADRAVYLGDPDFVKVPVKKLMDANYIKNRMSDYDPAHATPGNKIKEGFIQKEEEETTHFSIVDGDGTAVTVTTTLNGSYGSKVFVSGSGFLMNNEMDDFSIKPGVPNSYGLTGSDANAIEPGKRMLSSMTPTIIEKKGKLFMVVGSPGGSTIITTVLQTILNVTEFNYSMQGAVNAGRFHHQWQPDSLYFESGKFSDEVVQQLQRMGYATAPRSPIGEVNAILILPDDKREGAADLRGDGSAMGY